MPSQYGDEKSSLRVAQVIPEFLKKHTENFLKRVFYQYFLRDFSIASVQLLAGIPLLLFSTGFGGYHWWRSFETGVASTGGTVMLAALTFALGVQCLFSFLNYDMTDRRRLSLQRQLK